MFAAASFDHGNYFMSPAHGGETLEDQSDQLAAWLKYSP